ncbi:MAG: hypothetical protein ACTSUE_22535 [Promethearchaeota archaeon]
MIHSLFIIDRGISIYSYHFKKTDIDGQLLSGFLSAIGSFAQETFQTGLQTISIRNGEKMNFYVEDTHGLIFCAISNDKDNNKLLGKLLKRISTSFVHEKGEILKTPARSDMSKYKDFDGKVKTILKGKTIARNGGMIVAGLAIGIGIFVASLFAFVYIIEIMMALGFGPVIELTATYYLAAILFIASMTAGFFGGSPKVGMWTGIAYFVVFIVVVFFILKEFADFIYLFAPFLFVVCMAGGYFGGLRSEMRRLYVVPKIR